MRKHKFFEDSVKLFHPEKTNNESGYIIYKISIKFLTLDTKIYEDNKEIEDCFYDPFEKDPNVIKEVIKIMIEYNNNNNKTITYIQLNIILLETA